MTIQRTRKTVDSPSNRDAGGRAAVAITPPNYGIDLADRGMSAASRTQNPTGMPAGLQAGLESMSGLNLSDVRVHTNSSKPAGLNALAFAQGSEIHLGPNQERHLPHEAWHVVQQRQGRVTPTFEANGVLLNTDAALEREADAMSARAAARRWSSTDAAAAVASSAAPMAGGAVQLLEDPELQQFVEAATAITKQLDISSIAKLGLQSKALELGVAAETVLDAQRAFQIALQEEGVEGEAFLTGRKTVEVATISTKYKTGLFGLGKGRVEFESAPKELPEFQQISADATFFSATKLKHVTSIRENGFKTSYGGSGTGSVSAPQNVGQFNSRDHIYFFNSALNAKKYGENNVDGDFAIVEFHLPMTTKFTPDPESGFSEDKLNKTQALRTAQDIAPSLIVGAVAYMRKQVGKPKRIF